MDHNLLYGQNPKHNFRLTPRSGKFSQSRYNWKSLNVLIWDVLLQIRIGLNRRISTKSSFQCFVKTKLQLIVITIATAKLSTTTIPILLIISIIIIQGRLIIISLLILNCKISRFKYYLRCSLTCNPLYFPLLNWKSRIGTYTVLNRVNILECSKNVL